MLYSHSIVYVVELAVPFVHPLIDLVGNLAERQQQQKIHLCQTDWLAGIVVSAARCCAHILCRSTDAAKNHSASCALPDNVTSFYRDSMPGYNRNAMQVYIRGGSAGYRYIVHFPIGKLHFFSRYLVELLSRVLVQH